MCLVKVALYTMKQFDTSNLAIRRHSFSFYSMISHQRSFEIDLGDGFTTEISAAASSFVAPLLRRASDGNGGRWLSFLAGDHAAHLGEASNSCSSQGLQSSSCLNRCSHEIIQCNSRILTQNSTTSCFPLKVGSLHNFLIHWAILDSCKITLLLQLHRSKCCGFLHLGQLSLMLGLLLDRFNVLHNCNKWASILPGYFPLDVVLQEMGCFQPSWAVGPNPVFLSLLPHTYPSPFHTDPSHPSLTAALIAPHRPIPLVPSPSQERCPIYTLATTCSLPTTPMSDVQSQGNAPTDHNDSSQMPPHDESSSPPSPTAPSRTPQHTLPLYHSTKSTQHTLQRTGISASKSLALSPNDPATTGAPLISNTSSIIKLSSARIHKQTVKASNMARPDVR